MGTTLAPPSADPGIGSSGADMELGSLLGDAFDAATGDVPGGEGGNESSQPFEAEPEVPIGEGGTEPQVAQSTKPNEQQPKPEEQTQSAEATADTGGYQLSPDGKSLMVPRAELAAIQAARQFQQQMQQYFATPQEAQDSYFQAASHRTMSNDWQIGSPDAIKSVMAHWAGANHAGNPVIQQQYQQSFAKMAQAMPEMLKSINPQAHEAFINGTVKQAIDIAYDKAARTGNPDDFKRAQELDWGVTGQYKTELPKIDPNAQAAAALADRERALNAQTERMERTAVENFNRSTLEVPKFQQLNAEIDKVLAKVKDRYPELAYNDLKNGIQRELIDAISGKADPAGLQAAWWLEHEQTFHGLINDYKQSWRSGRPGEGLQARTQAYIADFLAKARRSLPAIAAKRIEGTRTRTAKAGQPAATQPQARPNAQPSVNGTPSNPVNGRMPSEQWDKEWDDMWKSM